MLGKRVELWPGSYRSTVWTWWAQGKGKHFYKAADVELPRNKLVISWQSESMQRTNCAGSREKPLDPPDLQILEKGFPASPLLQGQHMGQRAPSFQPQRLNFFFWLSNKMEGNAEAGTTSNAVGVEQTATFLNWPFIILISTGECSLPGSKYWL